ncbi:immunoglobulin-like domain-containing protein [Microbacterium flavescens]|uniref:immunoglobulin-like domain-containing protein n=1 Tax=Microbacterium flavescens TaxID=69366 RepID=UPI001BDF7003|nr:immunoglobulin-like domain-containing protein [Microbacterium flavescens]
MRTRQRTRILARGGAVATAVALALTGAVAPAAHAAIEAEPLIHYSFEAASGTTIPDVSGNSHNATLRQSGGSVSGGVLSLPGGARGTAAFVEIPSAPLVGKKDLTISTWLSPRSGPMNTAAAFIGIQPASGNVPPSYWLLNPSNPSGYVKSVFTNSVNTTSPWSTEVGTGGTGSPTTPAGMNLYTTVINGTSGQFTVYLNGAQIGQNVISRSVADFSGNLIASLGRSVYNDTSWNGLIDDFAVYDQALSGADVQSLYASQVFDRAIPAVTVAEEATADFTVATSSAGLPVSWASDNAAIAISGGSAAVTRPAAGAGDANVTLTATFTLGAETRTATFAVRVPQEIADSEKVAQDLTAIEIGNLDDIRTNFSVPATGPQGSTIQWTVAASGADHASLRDGVREGSRTVEVQRPAAGADAVTVELIATASSGTASASRTFSARIQPMPAGDDKTEAYFWTFFTGEGQGAERVSIAASKGNDALAWNTLNDGQPIFTSTVGTEGLRDPYIIRSPEGDKFYMIATDLKVAGLAGGFTTAQISGSKYIEVWESTDLVNWSDQRHVKVSTDFAGNTWAPEAFWSEELDTYVVFWASNLYPTTNAADRTAVTYNRMMYATTDDFVTFSEPKVWIDVRRGTGLGMIDSTVAKVDGVYHRFTKDEANMTIRHEKSTNLLATYSGSLPGATGAADQWTLVKAQVGTGLPNGEGRNFTSGEGANIIQANEGDVNGLDWFLFIDQPSYHGGPNHYIPFGTDNLNDGNAWVPLGSKLRTGLPQNADGGKPRHGTVIPVTRAEYQRVLEAYAPDIAVATVGAMDVTTKAGLAPVLPQAQLTKVDGSQQTVDVQWDAVDPADYATPGTFTVSGVAQDDSRMPVEATVTVESAVEVTVTADTRCVAGKVVLTATLANAGDTAAQVAVSTPYGAKSATIAAGKKVSYAFSTRVASIAAGEVSVTVDDAAVSADYALRSCG